MKPLAQTPDEIVEIRNDNHAKALLLQLGILESFPQSPRLSEPWAASLAYADHSTHWIVATRFTGFPSAIDNGYFVLCIPKSRYTLQTANRYLHARNHIMFPDGLNIDRHEPIKPPQS